MDFAPLDLPEQTTDWLLLQLAKASHALAWLFERDHVLLAIEVLAFLGAFALLVQCAKSVFLELRFLRRLPGKADLHRRLRGLRRQAHGRGGIHPTAAALGATPIGLVLSGGGAKGAYEVGALRALRRFGVNDFAAIAGTSVGALNGALIAQGDCEAADHVWSGIGFRRVLAFRWGVLWPSLMRLLLLPLLFFTPGWKLVFRFKRPGESLRATAVRLTVELFVGLALVGLVMVAIAPFVGWKVALQAAAQDGIQLVALVGAAGAVLFLLLCGLHNFSATHLSLLSNGPLQDLVGSMVVRHKLDQMGSLLFVTHAKLGVTVTVKRGGRLPTTSPPPPDEAPPKKVPSKPRSVLVRWITEHIVGPADRVPDYGPKPDRPDPGVKVSVQRLPVYRRLNDLNELLCLQSAMPALARLLGRAGIAGGGVNRLPVRTAAVTAPLRGGPPADDRRRSRCC